MGALKFWLALFFYPILVVYRNVHLDEFLMGIIKKKLFYFYKGVWSGTKFWTLANLEGIQNFMLHHILMWFYLFFELTVLRASSSIHQTDFLYLLWFISFLRVSWVMVCNATFNNIISVISLQLFPDIWS